jgi:serine/threonine protein kinase
VVQPVVVPVVVSVGTKQGRKQREVSPPARGMEERKSEGKSGGEKNVTSTSANELSTECEASEEKVGPDSFIVHQVLGKGSFGEVYLVEKVSNHRYYAMKVLSKTQIMSQNLVKYALTERDVLSVTHHPFIVRLNYAFQTNKKLFLILDYCPGGDLSEYIEKEKRYGALPTIPRFTEDRARIYLAEVLLALQDLHKRDIIYRDLKPDNVVLDEDGHALLTDFGLSKQGVMDNVTAMSFCGSVAYLAPEMLKRSGHGKAVDWYLFGVLMYEMLVGQPPYFHKNKYSPHLSAREQLFLNIQKGVLKIPSRMSEEAKSLIVGVMSLATIV